MENPSGCSDAELVAQARAGEPGAFDGLVRAHYQRAYNTAYRLLGDHERAEDATVEAFARAYRSLPRFRGEAAFSTWLFRIVVNLCRDYLRGRPAPLRSLEELGGREGDQPREVADDSADPAQSAEQRSRQETVHQALQEITADHRTVLVLYDLSGFAYEEIAGVLRVPVGTVKSRLSRARLALKEVLLPHRELFE
jgi:RNA polymerase sigma-70 factor (ECF subfamily)